ncbi:MAG TPA: DegT/DnrJ/EryC1/StrS family aminotransferase [Pirellulales bacterium]|jgi:aminotransferase EvaB|nr:DegT/DnrJ/EryC1/StrS family aminotransferase [Pirellulales bacterium]
MFEYRSQWQQRRAEMLAAIAQVLDSGTLILGPRVREFEREFARYLGADDCAVGVASGTDALALALRVLGVGAGDEVITTANTAVPTVSAIRMVGATPVFCEIDRRSLLMNVCDAARRITSRTRALLPVHLFGNMVDMPAVMRLAGDRNLRVVEDCAQCTGATLGGRHAGTFGDIGCFSFYPTKNLGAYGDGGLCLACSDEIADALRSARCFGARDYRVATCEGVTSRLDELQAAILLVKLRDLVADVAERRRLAQLYREQLSDGVDLPTALAECAHAYHLFVIAVDDRAKVIGRLEAEQIGYGIHYPVPIHLMPAYRFLGYSLPLTERAAERILSLPCYPGLTDDEVARICEVVNSAIAE